MRLPVKYLRRPDAIALATPGSFHIHSSQFSLRDTISRVRERNITSLHGESSATRVHLYSGYSREEFPGILSEWLPFRFHGDPCRAHASLESLSCDVCDKVTFSLSLSPSRTILRSETCAKLCAELLRCNFFDSICFDIVFPSRMTVDRFCRFAMLTNCNS